jgi:hypothetical protein
MHHMDEQRWVVICVYIHVQCNQSHDIINSTITEYEKKKALNTIRLLYSRQTIEWMYG